MGSLQINICHSCGVRSGPRITCGIPPNKHATLTMRRRPVLRIRVGFKHKQSAARVCNRGRAVHLAIRIDIDCLCRWYLENKRSQNKREFRDRAGIHRTTEGAIISSNFEAKKVGTGFSVPTFQKVPTYWFVFQQKSQDCRRRNIQTNKQTIIPIC